ncbi:hypothetical protein [Caulobacter sp.]|uniref:hypothetical protein n=1 Tax=Caulobacter sp. TaxID=78 RepID=UPI001B09ED9D|nr:hypothetical protein [Caulobacter sp.]MBO9546539.1 hypothetical protein [Caulobacter sp.]
MTLLTYAVPLLWLTASAGAFFLVFKPRPRWSLVGTPARALVAFVVVFVAGGALTAVTRPDDTPAPKLVIPARPANLPEPALVRAHPENYLTLGKVTFIRGKTGSLLATGRADNISGLPLRDPTVRCRMPGGEVSATVHAVVSAGGSLVFAAVDMGRVDGAWDHGDCAITKAQVAG